MMDRDYYAGFARLFDCTPHSAPRSPASHRFQTCPSSSLLMGANRQFKCDLACRTHAHCVHTHADIIYLMVNRRAPACAPAEAGGSPCAAYLLLISTNASRNILVNNLFAPHRIASTCILRARFSCTRAHVHIKYLDCYLITANKSTLCAATTRAPGRVGPDRACAIRACTHGTTDGTQRARAAAPRMCLPPQKRSSPL